MRGSFSSQMCALMYINSFGMKSKSENLGAFWDLKKNCDNGKCSEQINHNLTFLLYKSSIMLSMTYS